MKSGQRVFLLRSWSGASCGVYTSRKKLAEAVDFWTKFLGAHEPKLVLTYEEWDINYIPEPSTWDWAYISPECTWEELAGGGGIVPFPEFLGKNLINTDWEGEET